MNRSIKMQLLLKRLIDIIAALIILVAFLPIWLIVMLLIRIDSPGPVFYTQLRPGRHTKIFKIYKFRTMKPGSDHMIAGKEVMSDDHRITRLGYWLRRFKIDEIPQLFNVLVGEMSLVGPRPERMEYLPDYSISELKRFEMRPGLTGLAQVSGNIYISLEKRHQFDVQYVENFSIWLDVKIIVRTFGVMLLGEDKFVDDGNKEKTLNM